MLKVTEMDMKERTRERIETGVVTAIPPQGGMVVLSRYLPNGKLEELNLFCSAWDTVKPGETCLDFQRCYAGGSNSSVRIIGYTPEDIAQDFMKEYQTRKAAQ